MRYYQIYIHFSFCAGFSEEWRDKELRETIQRAFQCGTFAIEKIVGVSKTRKCV